MNTLQTFEKEQIEKLGRTVPEFGPGDTLRVKVISIDDQDRVKLSRKVLLREENPDGVPPGVDLPPRPPRPHHHQPPKPPCPRPRAGCSATASAGNTGRR